MAKQNTTKKHIVTSFHNLTPELQDAVKEKYPLGFTEAMMRVDKPNGDFFYAVPFDTDEIAYMVKIDVKIDDNAQVRGSSFQVASTNGRSASKNDYLKALQYEFTLPLPNNRKWDLDKEIIPIFKTL